MTMRRRAPIVRDRKKSTLRDVCARRKQTIAQFVDEACCKNADDVYAIAAVLGCERPTQDEIDECRFQSAQNALVKLTVTSVAPAQIDEVILEVDVKASKAEQVAKKKEDKKSQKQCNDMDGVVKLKYKAAGDNDKPAAAENELTRPNKRTTQHAHQEFPQPRRQLSCSRLSPAPRPAWHRQELCCRTICERSEDVSRRSTPQSDD